MDKLPVVATSKENMPVSNGNFVWKIILATLQKKIFYTMVFFLFFAILFSFIENGENVTEKILSLTFLFVCVVIYRFLNPTEDLTEEKTTKTNIFVSISIPSIIIFSIMGYVLIGIVNFIILMIVLEWERKNKYFNIKPDR